MTLVLNMIRCYACGHSIDKNQSQQENSRFLKSEVCPKCHTDLKCCHMCSHYDRSAYNECREPSAERVVEKTKANFCDFFIINFFNGNAMAKSLSPKDNVLKLAESLFKK